MEVGVGGWRAPCLGRKVGRLGLGLGRENGRDLFVVDGVVAECLV